MKIGHRVTVTVSLPGEGWLARQWVVDSLPLPDEMFMLHCQPGARIHWTTPDPHAIGPCGICDELKTLGEMQNVDEEGQEGIAPEPLEMATTRQ